MATGGDRIRQARLARRWSQSRLAYALNLEAGTDTLTREYIARWERGGRNPGYEWALVIERVLDGYLTATDTTAPADMGAADGGAPSPAGDKQALLCDGLLVDSASGSDEVNRRQLLGLGAVVAMESARQEMTRVVAGHVSERAGIDEWEAVAAEYGHSYLVTPPEILLTGLSTDIPLLQKLLATSSDRLRPEYCRVASQLAVITARAWSSMDEYRQAWRWWRTARELADASGDPAIRMLCRGEEIVIGLYEHRPVSLLLDLANEAVEIGGHVPSRGAVGLWAGVAQAHATVGNTVDAVRALRQLERLAESLPSATTGAVDSIYGWPEYRTRHTQSYVFTQLGNRAAAGAAQDRALELYPVTLPAPRADVELHRARCMVLEHDIHGGLTHATGVIADLPEGIRRNALVLSNARKVLEALPPDARARSDAHALGAAIRW